MNLTVVPAPIQISRASAARFYAGRRDLRYQVAEERHPGIDRFSFPSVFAPLPKIRGAIHGPSSTDDLYLGLAACEEHVLQLFSAHCWE